MNFAALHNIGAYLQALGSGGGEAVAGGAGDATEVSGAWVDRVGTGLGHGALLVIFWKAVLAEGETLSITANIQDATSAAGAGAADFGTALPATVVATGPSGGGTVEGATVLDNNVEGASQFIRAQVTPNLSAATVDTVHWAAGFIIPKRTV